jgi:anti-anti-sigma regulatory factor
MRRCVFAGPALVVDMAGVEFLGVQGLRDLFELGEECGTAGLCWVVVAGDAVQRILRAAELENTLPVAGSVIEALQRSVKPSPAAARLLRPVDPPQ